MLHSIQTVADLSLIRQQYEREVDSHHANSPKVTSGSNAHAFAVRSVPLYTADGVPANCWGNQRCDNGVILGRTSERYGLVQNDVFEQTIRKGFESNGLVPSAFTAVVTRRGARSHMQFDFATEKEDITRKGDIVALRITAKNSFDGTSRSSVSVGALRLVCTNGMTSYREDVMLSVRHTSNVNYEFVNNVVVEAMQEWSTLRTMWNNMSKVHLSQQQGINAIENMVNRGVIGVAVRKRVHEVWESPTYREDEARTLWNLYNAHTQVLTHSFGNQKYEMTARTSSQVLHTMVNASQHEQNYLELVATPEEIRKN
jgi:hypothetical protein